MAPPAYSPAKKDPALKLGLAIRGRYDLRFNDRSKAGRNRTSNHLSFDTAIVTADYDSAVLFGSAQYRFYGGSFIYGKESGYKNYPGEISFPLYGYLGAKINKTSQVTFGLAPVPFDDRWWGASFLNSIGFVYGLEEVYNLGAVLGHKTDKWSFDLGFFRRPLPMQWGAVPIVRVILST
ncbi:hypothetical protein [Asaia astilbis]|uniref:hypothetical protein n=1 Tax=Asaia astilbis TaxID=610244 RepID=UPI000B257E24|nr:hypothetical protein [Asaia astilbis]